VLTLEFHAENGFIQNYQGVQEIWVISECVDESIAKFQALTFSFLLKRKGEI